MDCLLCRAVFISTKDNGRGYAYDVTVIARYVGLSSFLPYPSGTPVFMRVSEALFARIFQNILIIA